MMTKKSKEPNFTAREVAILTQMVRQNASIMTSKFRNMTENDRKNELWTNIATSVNAVGICKRTSDEVKEKWRQLKAKAKSQQAKSKKEEKKTGGGPAVALDMVSETIADIFKADPSWEGIKGGSESAACAFTSPPPAATAISHHAIANVASETFFPLTVGPEPAFFDQALSTVVEITPEEEEVQRLCIEASSGHVEDLGKFEEMPLEEDCAELESLRSMAGRIERMGRGRKRGKSAVKATEEKTCGHCARQHDMIESEIRNNELRRCVLELKIEKLRLEVAKLKRES
ncbi:nuclear apoptosis-inducing factor 1-like [Lineus longissimus]|uniref:nuclear apoptosis-inducing factor 1-like n=1 Tax=Lineus longissimus TaxID=88925 RepID=UPI00315D7B15